MEKAEKEAMSFVSLLTCLLLSVFAFADVTETLRQLEEANGKRVCENFYRELGVGAKKVRTEVVHPEFKQGKFPLETVPGYRKDALYIGISNYEGKGGEGAHHYYLKVGNVRFAGAPLFKKPRVRKNNAMATKGALFEIPLPPEMFAAFEARARAGKVPRGLTCLHTLCSFLEDGGVVLHEREGVKKVSAKVVVANLLEGKVKISGKDADPETVRMLLTHKDELQHLLERATTADQREKDAIKADLFLYGTVGGVTSLVLVGGTGGAVWANKHYSQPAPQPKYRPLGTIDD